MNYLTSTLAFILIFFFSHSSPAQTNYNYLLAKNYSLVIHGGSNLHDWTETAGKASGTGIVSWNDNGSFDLNNLRLIVQVNSITSTEGSIMNNKTYKALDASRHPEITFALTSASKSIPADGKEHALTASGMLTIAGVTQPVTLHANVRAILHGTISFDGSQRITMSDYHIAPPTALLGALKVTNDVTLQFKTVFIANNN